LPTADAPLHEAGGVPKWSLTNQSRADARHARGSATRAESDDTSHGVRTLSAKTTQAIVGVLVCLASTIRSQGFSPSQRFDPAWALRLYFAPLPPLGFLQPSEL
jgi:hypothetical protein